MNPLVKTTVALWIYTDYNAHTLKYYTFKFNPNRYLKLIKHFGLVIALAFCNVAFKVLSIYNIRIRFVRQSEWPRLDSHIRLSSSSKSDER